MLPSHHRGDVVVLARSPGPPVSSERGDRDRRGGTAGGGRETHATPRTPLSRLPSCGSLVAAGAPVVSIRIGCPGQPTACGVRSGPRACGGWISPVKSLAGRLRPGGPVRPAVAAAARDGRVSHARRRSRLSLARPSSTQVHPSAHVQTRAYTTWASPRLVKATQADGRPLRCGQPGRTPHTVPAAVYQAWQEERQTRATARCRWEALVGGVSRGPARHFCWHIWGRQVTVRGGKAPAAINLLGPPRTALRGEPDAHMTSEQDSRRQRSGWYCHLCARALSPLATRPSTVVGRPRTPRGQQRVSGGESGPSSSPLSGA